MMKNKFIPKDTKKLNDLIFFICANSYESEDWKEI